MTYVCLIIYYDKYETVILTLASWQITREIPVFLNPTLFHPLSLTTGVFVAAARALKMADTHIWRHEVTTNKTGITGILNLCIVFAGYWILRVSCDPRIQCNL